MSKNIIPVVVIGIIIIILFLVFLSSPLTGKTPIEMQEKADELKEKSKTKLELARETYLFVDGKYNSTIRGYLKYPDRVFLKDREEIWNLEMEYIHSQTQNQIFKELLIQTGEFKEEDFELKQSFCLNSPHNYWILDINGQKVPIDLWGADHINLSSSFGCYSIPICEPEDFKCAEGFP